jgi:hypothetical protein
MIVSDSYIEVKFKNTRAYFKDDPEFDDLERNGAPVPVVLLDAEDRELATRYKWFIYSRPTSVPNVLKQTAQFQQRIGTGIHRISQVTDKIYRPAIMLTYELHRVVLGNPPYKVRAINGNYLDCRKRNLTFVRKDLAAAVAAGVPIRDVAEAA